MVIIYVTANPKRDKFTGVMFGDTLEKTYQKAWERVNNPPRMNIVIPVTKQNNDTMISTNLKSPMAEYTSTTNEVKNVEFQTESKTDFKVTTSDFKEFTIKEGEVPVYTIEFLLADGYRYEKEILVPRKYTKGWGIFKKEVTVNETVYIYNRRLIEIHKEENGEQTIIGKGYVVLEGKKMFHMLINM